MSLPFITIDEKEYGPAAWHVEAEMNCPAEVLSYVALQGFLLWRSYWTQCLEVGADVDVQLSVFSAAGLADTERTRMTAITQLVSSDRCPEPAARHFVNAINWVVVRPDTPKDFLAARIHGEVENLAGIPQGEADPVGGARVILDETGEVSTVRPWIFFLWPLGVLGFSRADGTAYLSQSAFGYPSLISEPGCNNHEGKIRRQARSMIRSE
jgi:hypothetical protein